MLRDLAGLLAKLGRLVPKDGLVLGLGRGKRGVAALAGLGNVTHDAVELFGWNKLAVLALVSQLAAGLPPARGLRRSPGCPRRIARGRPVRVPGIPAQPQLELPNALPLSLELRSQAGALRLDLCDPRRKPGAVGAGGISGRPGLVTVHRGERQGFD